MPKRKRIPLESDIDNVERGYEILLDFIENNKEIETTLWCTIFWIAITKGYRNSGFSYEEFLDEITIASSHFKKGWNDENLI
jgi:hypothetical protein